MVNADRDKSEQPTTSILSCHIEHQAHPITGGQVGIYGSTDGRFVWEPCDAADRLVNAAQRPSPGPEAPHATTDTPEAATQAQGRDERVTRYAEVLRLSTGLGAEYAAHAVMAVADAEQADLRAENERLRERAKHEHDRWKAQHGKVDRKRRAAERALAEERAKVARVEALADLWASRGCDQSDSTHPPHDPRWPGGRLCAACASVDITNKLAGPGPETNDWRRLNCPVCGSGEIGDCVCPETSD